MNITELFLGRYDPLYTFWLADIWSSVPQELMRQRPHPRVNSIAWNLWHLARVEDATFNRFITDGVQVLDAGDWQAQMNVPWRHNGGEMTFDEVDELDRRIDLDALAGYAASVEARTRQVAARLDQIDLDAVLDETLLRRVLHDEGLAHARAGGLLQNYLGWPRSKCLTNLGMTHPYQHVGEIGVIASLLGMTFE
jgi:hypothetical protein